MAGGVGVKAGETSSGAKVQRAGTEKKFSDFRAVFRASPMPHLVLSPQWNIVAANDAYLKATRTSRSEILGKYIFDVFPENPHAPSGGESALRNSLEKVVASAEADELCVLRYDIPNPATQTGFEERFWKPLNTPVLGEDGSIAYIIHQVEDVTEKIHLERKVREQTLILEVPNVFVRKLSGEIVFWNRGSQKVYGYSEADALGTNVHKLFCTRFPGPAGTLHLV